MTNAYSRRNKPLWLIGGVIALICLAGALWFILNTSFLSWDFRNNLWSPAHLTVTGRSPYVIIQLFEGSNSVWLPMIVGALAPLGWLPLDQATNLWALVNVVLYLAVIWLATGVRRPSPVWLAVALIGLMIFPSFVALIRLGQFGVIAAFLMMLAVRVRRKPATAALLVVLAAAKPQLILLPVMGLALLLYREYGRGMLAKFIGYGALWTVLLTIPLWLAHLQWVDGFLAALRANPAWEQPSAFVLLPLRLGALGWAIYALLLAAALAWNVYIWRRYPPHIAMNWSLAINLLVSPYAWTWDFVLMVPLFVQTLFSIRHIALKLLLSGGYAVLLYLMIAQRMGADNTPDWEFWWFPWAFMGLIVAVDRLNARKTA